MKPLKKSVLSLFLLLVAVFTLTACTVDPVVEEDLIIPSFIASSINPDPFVRGQGFVARLSGSTAEMLSMWFIMMFGAHPFVTINSVLTLQLKPVLTKEFFKDKEVSATFLGKVKLTYINETNIDTFDPSFAIKKYEVDGRVVKEITGSLAQQVRSGKVKEIKVYF